MTDFDRNIRTLISCFVVAVMVLVPLRIVEISSFNNENTMVLGEETFNYVVEEEILDPELVLDEENYNEEELSEEEIILPVTE